MNIVLIGYGKMGKAIEAIALERGHTIVLRIDQHNFADLEAYPKDQIDVAIEFSNPEAAFGNLRYCMENGIKVLSGTTGWLSQKPVIEELCRKHDGTFFYASNFSVGVNLFFKLNDILAKLMAPYKSYDVRMEEVHHTEKKDAPSGTAITLAEGVMRHREELRSWVNQAEAKEGELPIVSVRQDPAPGTHTITYRSEIDTIQISHEAHTRKGFAQGAVLVAEWIAEQKGVLSMQDFLPL